MVKRPGAVFAALILAAAIFVPASCAQWSGSDRVTLRDPAQEAQEFILEARSMLAQIDDRLDVPMSEGEKSASQLELDKAREAFFQAASLKPSIGEVHDTARQARDLSAQALAAARAGNRPQALQLFTQARIKLQQARLALAQATGAVPGSPFGALQPSHPGGQSGAASGAGQGITIRSPLGTGLIKIGPGGIKLEGEAAGEKGAITIGPGGIRLGGQTHGEQGGIDITPQGIDLGGRSGQGKGNIHVSPDGAGINEKD